MNAREIAARIQAKTKHNAAWKGNRLTTRCPAHQDTNPSLSISVGKGGRVLLKCHAGCEAEAVCRAVDLAISDLMPDRPPASEPTAKPPRGREVAAYAYRDEEGTTLFEVVRFDPKGFRQRRPDPTNPAKHIWNREGVRSIPYRLPELSQAKAAGGLVIIVEGEKDADNLGAWSYLATCNAGGAGKWTEEHTNCLGSCDIVVIPDNDQTGREHAAKILQSLTAHGNRAWALHLPSEKNGRPVKDFSDWQAAGGSQEEFQVMLDIIRSQPPTLSQRSSSVLSVSPSLVADGLGGMREWPSPPAAAAFQGLLGEMVNTLSPYTEADPVALLIHGLAMFGSAVGRNPHWTVNDSRHGCNLFAVCVGPTGTARKGTAADMIKALFQPVDPEWTKGCIKSGLVSSEGLLFHIRDANEVSKDKGVMDKRLLVLESEFARLLNTMQRHGSTLSAELRKAWDGNRMESLAKNCHLVVSEPHVSLIGHIVRDELLACLENTDAVNGFGNRLLFACVRRDKELPFGGTVPEPERQQLAQRLAKAVTFAKRVMRPVDFAPEAREAWAAAYSGFHRPVAGIIGSLLNRSDAMCRRIAMVYALADCSDVIRPAHLQAALALWKYAEASCRYVFGDSTGNRVAEKIKAALRDSDGSLSRTEINDLFHGNAAADSIDNALQLLITMGLVEIRQEAKPGGGRPATRIHWIATKGSENGKTE